MKPPKWLLQREGLTYRQWKSRKRRELQKVIKAMETYNLGCAYTPSKKREDITIQFALASLKHELSVKNWGR